MIIKNLARKSGGSAQLVKYIFRYIFREEKAVGQEKPAQDITLSDDTGLRREYEQALREAEVEYMKKDIDYLIAEHNEAKLMANMQEQEQGAEGTLVKENAVPYGQPEVSPFVIKHNIRSNTLEGFVKEFQAVEALRIHKRSNQTQIFHTILSFGKDDKKHITQAMLKVLAAKYIELRGVNNLYCGTLHADKDHIHLHISMSATQLNGMSSRISKKEFEEVKLKLQEYQREKYPQLVHSLPEHGRSWKEYEKTGVQNIKRNERATVKNELLRHIEAITPENRSNLLEEIQSKGYTAYYRQGKLAGVQHEGSRLKFRFSRLGVDPLTIEQSIKDKEREMGLLEEFQALRKGERKRARGGVEIGQQAPNMNGEEARNEKTALEEFGDLRESDSNETELEVGFDSD